MTYFTLHLDLVFFLLLDKRYKFKKVSVSIFIYSISIGSCLEKRWSDTLSDHSDSVLRSSHNKLTYFCVDSDFIKNLISFVLFFSINFDCFKIFYFFIDLAFGIFYIIYYIFDLQERKLFAAYAV